MKLKNEAYLFIAKVCLLLSREGKRIDPVDEQLPLVRLEQRADDLQERRLTRTTRPDDRGYLTLMYREGYLLEYLQRAKGLADRV